MAGYGPTGYRQPPEPGKGIIDRPYKHLTTYPKKQNVTEQLQKEADQKECTTTTETKNASM